MGGPITRGGVGRWVLFGLILLLPGMVEAQEAVLTGTITDATGGVLPGVTVVAVHEATGNRFEAVTDERGIYRIPARVGGYTITAELDGFAPATRANVQLLVGQTVTINLQMQLSTLQETVQVTAEEPLLDVSTSVVGGNIDPRQMQELPVQGRDWTALALLAPGNRTTAMGGTPVQDRADVREYHMNVDGQQVTQTMGIGGQPLYSRDSIAEFQFVSNRFDASQGRSSGVLVNAVSKSGTNNVSGLFSSYFRDSDWNANDHVLNRVIPFSNQQVSAAVGGPILRDRVHFFGNYEYDRTPKTSIWNTPYPAFNITLNGKEVKHIAGGRVDYQLSPAVRIMGKVSGASHDDPFGIGSATQHPASTGSQDRENREYLGQYTHVVSNRAVNEVKGGFAEWNILQGLLTNWSNHWARDIGVTEGHPRVQMVGLTIGGNQNAPRVRDQNMYFVRDDFSLSYEARGRHDLKAGGEYLFMHELTRNCRNCMGLIDARLSRIPADVMQAIFPDPFNADTWNLNALAPYTRRFTLGISDTFRTPFDVPRTAAWVQDDWRVASNLTLNLGLRYDLIWDAWANYAEVQPILDANRPQDTDNIQPRVGFAWQVDDRTVVRGGVGRYYGDVLTNLQMWTLGNNVIASVEVNNDGRADFPTNPFNGPKPTPTQAFANFCDVNNRPGCLTRGLQELAPPPPYDDVQNSWQTSIGFQRQFGTDMSVEVDYVFNGSRDEKVIQENVNVSFDPRTGEPLPYSNRALRPYPLLGIISVTPYTGWSNYHGVQTAFTKRFSRQWQASATYTVGGLWNAAARPLSGRRMVDFSVSPDLGDEYTLAETDQRHRIVFNGIWQPGFGFQVSGVYFFGSGERDQIEAGDVNRDVGEWANQRYRENGTIIPRYSFVGDQIHRVDLRLQQRIRLVGRAGIDGIFEVFNVFDRANYGSYVLDESNRSFLQPAQNANLAYAPRTLQLGFRLTF
ncbi:MAG: TonB-dependent receptor [Acidobacteria bacterium]|nr:TonB-dependent receptor [Acidobacteriota bacterium]